jgi:glycogen debranching enzyme
VKYNTDWLVRDVPAGRGMSAGMPDYPWWFGTDAEYTLKGLVATGKKDLVYDAVEVLNKLSEKENGNGRIVHEVSSNGVVLILAMSMKPTICQYDLGDLSVDRR